MCYLCKKHNSVKNPNKVGFYDDFIESLSSSQGDLAVQLHEDGIKAKYDGFPPAIAEGVFTTLKYVFEESKSFDVENLKEIFEAVMNAEDTTDGAIIKEKN